MTGGVGRLWGSVSPRRTRPPQAMRAKALLGFRAAAQRASPHPRAMAFAALGAGELLLESARRAGRTALLPTP